MFGAPLKKMRRGAARSRPDVCDASAAGNGRPMRYIGMTQYFDGRQDVHPAVGFAVSGDTHPRVTSLPERVRAGALANEAL